MDEMRINLKTRFMRGIVSKLISKAIKIKTGYEVNIQIEEIDFWSLNGDTTVKLNVEAKLNSEEFNKIIKSINID